MPITFKPQFYLIIGVVFFIAIIVAVAATYKPPPPEEPITPVDEPVVTPPPEMFTYTLKAGIGVASIKVTNQNTGAIATFMPQDLPAAYNFKNGETLTFTVTPQAGYRFNYWSLGDGTIPSSATSYTIKPVTHLVIEAHFLMINPIG